jgi:hypothetical protein
MTDDPLTNGELDELEALMDAATPPPWTAFVEDREPIGGQSFIQLGAPGFSPPDMYVYHDSAIAPAADLDFIAAARRYVPRLLAEVRRRRDEERRPEHG